MDKSTKWLFCFNVLGLLLGLFDVIYGAFKFNIGNVGFGIFIDAIGLFLIIQSTKSLKLCLEVKSLQEDDERESSNL